MFLSKELLDNNPKLHELVSRIVRKRQYNVYYYFEQVMDPSNSRLVWRYWESYRKEGQDEYTFPELVWFLI